MKLAIVGCGMIADTHLKEIRKIPGTHIAGVCDKEILMAEQLSERYDIPAYFDDFDELLFKTKPDAVHILTPPATHHHLGINAMKAGCHVIVEKPFAVNLKQTEELIENALALNRKIVVNHFHNFSPPAMQLKKMVTQGAIGKILHMDGFYSYDLKSPVAVSLLTDKNNWIHKLPGKLLQNNIDHLISKFVEYIPDDAPNVQAGGMLISEEARQSMPSRVHDELRVMIKGEAISAYATFSSNIEPFQHCMSLYGTKGSVLLDYESRTVMFIPRYALPGPFGKLSRPFLMNKKYCVEGIRNLFAFLKSDFHFYAGANLLFRQFYRCIKENGSPPITYDCIMKEAMIVDEIIAQLTMATPTGKSQRCKSRRISEERRQG
jgi:predicted dehydrogenase